MPVPGFLSQIADKAQGAINKSPLAGHIPSSIYGRPANTTGSDSSEDVNASSSSSRGGAFGQLQHQFRSLQIQYGYGSANPIQRIVTTAKSTALDLEAFKRDSQAHSKEIYMWGQNEAQDLKDVTDRIAWLNYITGSLASTTADKLNASRNPLKALRDSDAALAPRRNARASLQQQIDRLEQNKEKGYEKRIVELRDQLRKAEADDAPDEKESEILKRKALRESERLKFEALREFGEKLSLIAQASAPVMDALPSIPPSSATPYSGAEATGNIRATLQHSLDHWKPGDVLLRAPAGARLDRSHTRAFGETHAMELSKIDSERPHANAAPMDSPGLPQSAPPSMPHPTMGSSMPLSSTGSQLPTVQEKEPTTIATSVPAPAPIPAPSTGVSATSPVPKFSSSLSTVSNISVPSVNSSGSPPIDPHALNNAPAPIPASASPPSAIAAPNPIEPEAKVPSVTPTVAETGLPLQANKHDPGPASGSLKDLRDASAAARSASQLGSSSIIGAKHETAEEEKRRLEREERERVLNASASPSQAASSMPKYESAEEEKKRLEREERERLLHGAAPPPSGNSERRDGEGGDEAMPPPYQDF